MNSRRLFTWLDIRRIISQHTNYGKSLPDGIVRISCFSDALEIGIESESNPENATHILKKWFGDWYQEEKSIIQLDIGDAILPVELIYGEEPSEFNVSIRPFWEEIAYLKDKDEAETVQNNDEFLFL